MPRMKKEYTAFNQNLKKMREQKGYAADEFASLIGMGYSTYIAYENKDREPSFAILIKMANVLNVTTDELLGNEQTELQRCIDICEKCGFKLLSKDDDIVFSLSPKLAKKTDSVLFDAVWKKFIESDAITNDDAHIIYSIPPNTLISIVHEIMDTTIYHEILTSLTKKFRDTMNFNARLSTLKKLLQEKNIQLDVNLDELSFSQIVNYINLLSSIIQPTDNTTKE